MWLLQRAHRLNAAGEHDAVGPVHLHRQRAAGESKRLLSGSNRLGRWTQSFALRDSPARLSVGRPAQKVIQFVLLDLPIERGRAPFHHHGDAFVIAFGIAKRGFQPLTDGVALPGKPRVRLKIRCSERTTGPLVMSSARWMTF
jgi:hypothetical protein